ncbi:hypothetical protein F8B43_2590 [Methylorubrum populi]|uniref:Uncharacterized protein n=1 Tax=Methylorubrum populi TaxID=223967 RepID=A0A833MWQ6_9HYPH|nr:hypothetical protein F8B43_2590 [Methylorubrum populi]
MRLIDLGQEARHYDAASMENRQRSSCGMRTKQVRNASAPAD